MTSLREALAEWDSLSAENRDPAVPFNVILTRRATALEALIGAARRVVEPRGDNPATTEARQIKQMEAIIESQPAASTSEHGTARSDQIGNFCRRHPAALYIRKYGCPSCDQKLPPYLLPVSR